jgi:low temperature requirement protein LtrA
MAERPRFLRPAPLREFDVGERRASWLELFFDLCFVAAVAALSAHLHADPSFEGIARFLLLFVPVWWAWMGFTWYATAWDNDDPLFRFSFLTAMFLVVVLAGTIPDIQEDGGAAFALTYAAMQGVIALLFVKVLPHAGEAIGLARNYLIGNVLGGLLFAGSVLVEQPLRSWIWVLAMIDLLVWPVLAVRAYAGQPFDSRHIPERYGLFTIVVLGESVVAVAAGISEVRLNADAALAGALGFGIGAAFWWSYFETVTSDPLSRDRVGAAFLWGYGHFLAFAGIAMTAVGVDFSIVEAARDGSLNAAQRVMLCGGPAAFVLSLAAIHAAGVRRWDEVLMSRAGQLTALALIGVAGAGLRPEGVTAVVLVVMAVGAALDVRFARRSEASTGLHDQQVGGDQEVEREPDSAAAAPSDT